MTKILILITIALTLAAQKPSPAQSALKAAIDKEVADGDIKAAIALYNKVANTYKADKSVAAQALLRLGQCHEKLGASEAASAYDRLIKQYGDQKEAGTARVRLAALRGPAPQTPTSRLAWTMSYSYSLGNVSPDGRYQAYISGQEGGITLRDLQSGETRIVPGAEKGENPYEAVVSHDAKWIAYGSQPNWGLQELRVVSTAGGAPRTVFKTGKEANVGWVVPTAWTPDGKEVLVVFNRLVANGYHVGMISVETGKLRTLREFEYGFYRSASLSPDGKWVAYNVQTSPDGVECDIYVIRADGSGEQKLIDHPADDIDPHWTPDGRGLVWRSNRRGSIDAFFVPVKDGRVAGNPTLVKTDVQEELLGVSRSGTLFYQSYAGTQDLHMLRLDPETGAVNGAPQKLPLAFSGHKMSVVVSPDGDWLAYVRPSLTTPRVAYIVIRSLQTGQERDIHPKVKNLRSIAWSQDGKSIAILARNMRDVHTLYLMDLAAGSLKTVLDKQVHPDYNIGFSAASFAPDGRTFYPPTWRDGMIKAIVAVQTEDLQTRVLYRQPGRSFSRPWASPDGRLVAAAFTDRATKKNGVVVVDAATAEVRLNMETAELLSLNGWTPDGKHLVVYAATVAPDNYVARSLAKVEAWRVPVDGGTIVKSPLPELFRMPDQPIPQGNGNFLVQPSGSFAHEIWAVDNCLPKN